jgi:hypothetical protein
VKSAGGAAAEDNCWSLACLREPAPPDWLRAVIQADDERLARMPHSQKLAAGCVSRFGVAVVWQMASPVEKSAGPSQSKEKKVTTFATKWQKKSSKRK